MNAMAINVAVISGGKILLTQREDFETWILPSGGVEEGETLAQAAVRETKEETGLDVRLIRLVGVYSRLGNLSRGYVALFAAEPIGGEIRCQEGETIAVEWFDFASLPSPLSAGHSRRIEDAVSGAVGIVVSQSFQAPGLPVHISRDELLNRRDRSGLPRPEFYVGLVRSAEVEERVEVQGMFTG